MEQHYGYRPGVLAGMIDLHMRYYGPEWSFGKGFEALLAREMGAFAERYDPRRDLWLTLWHEGIMRGSIVLDGTKPMRAHLRWFVLDPAIHGKGVGRRILGEAIGFVDERGVALTYLTTFAGLDAAAALYEEVGFKLVRQQDEDRSAGGGPREQMWERPRRAKPSAQM